MVVAVLPAPAPAATTVTRLLNTRSTTAACWRVTDWPPRSSRLGTEFTASCVTSLRGQAQALGAHGAVATMGASMLRILALFDVGDATLQVALQFAVLCAHGRSPSRR